MIMLVSRSSMVWVEHADRVARRSPQIIFKYQVFFHAELLKALLVGTMPRRSLERWTESLSSLFFVLLIVFRILPPWKAINS